MLSEGGGDKVRGGGGVLRGLGNPTGGVSFYGTPRSGPDPYPRCPGVKRGVAVVNSCCVCQ